jgi:phosphonatase-like hydrolase
MTKISLVVFDIAGTIIEDHGEVVDAFRMALSENDIVATEDELVARKGASKREVIRHYIERQFGPIAEHMELADRTFDSFQRLVRNLYMERGVRPIPGALDTFTVLRNRGIKLATTTGFDREISRLILKQLEWIRLFAANITSTDVTHGRPAPYMIFHAMEAASVYSVDEVVTVGDTPLDLQAGANAGVRGIVGVLTGMHPRERLLSEPHTHLIASVAELPQVLNDMSC